MMTFYKEETQIAALESLLSNGESPAIYDFLGRTGFHLQDISEEGIIDGIKEVLKVITHKMYIAVNRCWARLVNSKKEVQDAIDDVANRPDADTSKLPISKPVAVAMGAVLAAAGGILVFASGKMAFEKRKAHLAEKKRLEEEERLRKEQAERIPRLKKQMYDGLATMYDKGIKTGKFLNQNTKDINEAITGFSETAKLVSRGVTFASDRAGDINHIVEERIRENQLNGNNPSTLKAAHSSMSTIRDFVLPASSSVSKVSKFFSGQMTQERKAAAAKNAQPQGLGLNVSP